MSSVSKLMGEPPAARIVLEGVAADDYNNAATWTFSNLDKLFGQAGAGSFATSRFINLECVNFIVPDPCTQSADFNMWYQCWRVRLKTYAKAYSQERCGASNREFATNPNFITDDGAFTWTGIGAQTLPTPSNQGCNDVFFYMLGENIRQSTSQTLTGSEANAADIHGNKLCVALDELSQIQVIIEMYKPYIETETATPNLPGPTAGNTGGYWEEIWWGDSPSESLVTPLEKLRTGQFCMILRATPVEAAGGQAQIPGLL